MNAALNFSINPNEDTKLYKRLLLVGLIAGTSSCAFLPGFANEEVRNQRVTDKAAWDLECDKSKLKVTKISETSYGVEGCGKRASYIMSMCSSGVMSGYYASVCTAILNSGDESVIQRGGSQQGAIQAGNAASQSANNAANHIMHHTPPPPPAF
jgi:hypothetical protein